MACPICRWGPASVCGRLSSASCWWPQTPAPSFVTSHVLQRKPSPHSSASSSSTKPWRNSSTWGTTTPSTRTTTWTNSPRTRTWAGKNKQNNKNNYCIHLLGSTANLCQLRGLCSHPDVHVLPQMFMRWALWPHQCYSEVLGGQQCHRLRNLLGSAGGQGTTHTHLVP